MNLKKTQQQQSLENSYVSGYGHKHITMEKKFGKDKKSMYW